MAPTWLRALAAGLPAPGAPPAAAGAATAPQGPAAGRPRAAAPRRRGKRRNRFRRDVLEALRKELYVDASPYEVLGSSCSHGEADSHAAHSTLSRAVLQKVLDLVPEPTLWLEIGSFIGASAIRTAEEVKRRNISTGIVCMDPFVGDWAMWEQHSRHMKQEEWDWLHMDDHGIPRLYETFLANLQGAGHDDIVLPIPVTGTVGTKVLMRLHQHGRLSQLPQVIYLDSAHEPEETLVELRRCWLALAPGGLLFGDDFHEVKEVRNDVEVFAKVLGLRAVPDKDLRRFSTANGKATQPVPGLIVVESHWLFLKEA